MTELELCGMCGLPEAMHADLVVVVGFEDGAPWTVWAHDFVPPKEEA